MSSLDQSIVEGLDELIQFGEEVKRSEYVGSIDGKAVVGDPHVNSELAYQWATSCLNLLDKVFGNASVHYRNFEAQLPKLSRYGPVSRGLGVLKAAKDDYEQGFLFETRVLIEAEVFDDFLEQAKHLIESDYYQPAAVVIGSVLEDGLRKLCTRNEVALSAKPKLDTMNAELTKQGVYNKLMRKRITFLADIRNKAAHGGWDQFAKADVEDMLGSVRQFMET